MEVERTLEALQVSLKVAAAATALAAVPGIGLGFVLARTRFVGKSLVESLLALPLFLPPTAVGYMLLVLFARDGWLGPNALGFDPGLLLTWRGAVAAAAIMSLPLVARTAQVAIESVPPRLESMGATLGFSRARVLLSITLPLARRGLLAALLVGFARALGEFGATVVVAGNIAGETQTLALALFEDIQLGRDDRALQVLGVSTVLAFAAVFAVERLGGRSDRSEAS